MKHLIQMLLKELQLFLYFFLLKIFLQVKKIRSYSNGLWTPFWGHPCNFFFRRDGWNKESERTPELSCVLSLARWRHGQDFKGGGEEKKGGQGSGLKGRPVHIDLM